MRFLVESHGRLGDLAINIALFRAIARDGHELEVLVDETNSSILHGASFISAVHAQPKEPSARARQYFGLAKQSWDAILLLRRTPLLKPMLLLRLGIRCRTVRHMDASLFEQGAVLHRLSILEGLVPTWREDVDTSLPMQEEEQERALDVAGAKTPQGILTVAPGAHIAAKQWPVSRFAEVIQAVRDRYPYPIIVGSPAEKGLCEELADLAGAISVAGKLSLRETCALVSCAAHHLGNDSGLGHVAAGNGVPTLAVGGSEDGHYVPWKQQMLFGDPSSIATEMVINCLHQDAGQGSAS